MEDEDWSFEGISIIRFGEKYCFDVDHFLPRSTDGAYCHFNWKIEWRQKTWWQAQCWFRDLSIAGKVVDLQDRIRFRDREDDIEFDQQQAEVKDIADEKYRELHQARDDDAWNSLTTLERKAEHDAKRLLRDTFLHAESSEDDVLILKLYNNGRARVHQACKALDLEHMSVNAPPSCYGSDRWIVVGLDRAAVLERTRSIGQQAIKERRRQEIAAAERKAAEARTDAATEQRSLRMHASISEKALAARERGQRWDVTGTWHIACEALRRNSTKPLTLEISYYEGGFQYLDRAPAKDKFCAEFDFNVVEGVMRIISPDPSESQKPCRMLYQWRGHDPDTEELEHSSDARDWPITFGQHGTKVTGAFSCAYGTYNFNGVKVREGRRQRTAGWVQWARFDPQRDPY